jgi:hypothetical protein
VFGAIFMFLDYAYNFYVTISIDGGTAGSQLFYGTHQRWGLMKI